MIIKLKDGRYMAPVRMGSMEDGGMTQDFYGVDLLSENKDLFGRPATEKFRLCDIEGFYGGCIFSPDQYNPDDDSCASYMRLARRLREESEKKPETLPTLL